MKARNELRSKGPKRVSPQQAVYELKHRVVVAINKIADRDTYKLGVQELEKGAESLNPDGIIPFLSCILDSDSEQKSAVRKECVRMMGVLAKFHGVLVGPHLGKMVACIVKRLKDQDSVVRDTCVETMGVLASEFGNSQAESEGIFVLLVRPLFEALSEQSKQIQAGAALCLARVIDNLNDPPVSILQKMLARTMKLLKNPHFMAKPAVIELNKSLIQAGGALSHSALSTAIRSIQETLNDTDWTTRKAASLALANIASSGGPFLAPFKDSCIQSLESCRFDKVKPVRDTVMQALHCWKNIEGQNVCALSDMASSIKDNLCGNDSSDCVSASSSVWKDVGIRESKANMVKKRLTSSSRRVYADCPESCNNSSSTEWQIDIAVPKMCTSAQYNLNEESRSSSFSKAQETMTADIISMQDIGHEYDMTEDKQEYSSSSNHVSDNFTNKFVAAGHPHSHGEELVKSIGGDQLVVEEGDGVETQSYIAKMRDCRSLDSTVTDAEEYHPSLVSGCHTENEIRSIRKQLSEIEKRQSSLMDLLQGFTTTTMETLSVIQLKVSSLEHAVDRIAHDLAHGGKHTDTISARYVEKALVAASPRISTASTPRLSLDTQHKNSAQASRNIEVSEAKTVGMRSKSNLVSARIDSRRQPLSMVNRNFTGEGPEKITRQKQQDLSYRQGRNIGGAVSSVSNSDAWQNVKMTENDIWKRVKDFLCEGNLESAYREALFSGDQLLLIELIDGTGPVLDSLSNRTISDLLTALASCILEHRVLEAIIPWLQQIVDLSDTHGPNCIPLSLKVRREILSAVQEALDIEVKHPAKRRLIAQLAMKLQQIWGKMSFNVS